jgi:hypothetical protein
MLFSQFRCRTIHAFLCALALGAAANATSKTYYVDPVHGNDSDDGLATAQGGGTGPLATVQRAVDVALPGDVILLRGGVYRPPVANQKDPGKYWQVVNTQKSGRPGKPITIAAFPGERPILKASLRVTGWVQLPDRDDDGDATNDLASLGFDVTQASGHVWRKTGWQCDEKGKLLLSNGWSYFTNPQQVFISDSETADGIALFQVSWPTSETTNPVDRFPYDPAKPSGNQAMYQGWKGVLTDLSNKDVVKAYNILEPGQERHFGFFYRDSKNGADIPDESVIYLWLPTGVDPNAKVTEVSVGRAILWAVDYFHLRGLTFRHNNSVAWQGMYAVLVGAGCLVEDCDVQYCDFTGLGLGQNSRARSCVVSWCGNTGFGMGRFSTLSESRISFCNYRNFVVGFHCGGMKIGHGAEDEAFQGPHGTVIENNEFDHNWGPSIWHDYVDEEKAPPITIRSNHIHHNVGYLRRERTGAGSETTMTRAMPQILVEASNGAIIHHNLIEANSTFTIGLIGAEDCQVFNNIIKDNNCDLAGDGRHPWDCFVLQQNNYPALNKPNGLSLDVAAGRTRPKKPLRGNRVFGNVFYNNVGVEAILCADLNEPKAAPPIVYDNYVDYNIYASVEPEQLRWKPTGTFAKWQEAGYDVHGAVVPLERLAFLKDIRSAADVAAFVHEAAKVIGDERSILDE